MNLTSDNTAVVLDSTADFPDAQIRFPNMRVVPLYVRFGEVSFRDYVELDPHGFYERLRTASASPRELDALIAAGAVDCLRKDQELEEIVAAIRSAGESRR